MYMHACMSCVSVLVCMIARMHACIYLFIFIYTCMHVRMQKLCMLHDVGCVYSFFSESLLSVNRCICSYIKRIYTQVVIERYNHAYNGGNKRGQFRGFGLTHLVSENFRPRCNKYLRNDC